MVFAKGTQKNMVLNCARSAGLEQQKRKVFRGKLNGIRNLPQVACSCYSGSDERCGDSCGWELIPGGKNGGFHDGDRGRMAPSDSKAEAAVSGGRGSGDFSYRLAVAISDGMGKGEAAACESERAVNSVLPLLKAGMDSEMALQVLNLLWSMSNRKEMFPTMDLALLDPVSRELVIYKIGAAPTVIVRAPRCRPGRTGACPQDAEASATCHTKRHRQAPACSIPPEQIEILTAPAMPMGVSEYSEIPSISTLVMPGDLIIMMTDGVADSLRSYPELDWLRRLLSRIKSRNLQTICDLIIREAALNYGDHEKDDMTVVLIRV